MKIFLETRFVLNADVPVIERLLHLLVYIFIPSSAAIFVKIFHLQGRVVFKRITIIGGGPLMTGVVQGAHGALYKRDESGRRHRFLIEMT